MIEMLESVVIAVVMVPVVMVLMMAMIYVLGEVFNRIAVPGGDKSSKY